MFENFFSPKCSDFKTCHCILPKKYFKNNAIFTTLVDEIYCGENNQADKQNANEDNQMKF